MVRCGASSHAQHTPRRSRHQCAQPTDLATSSSVAPRRSLMSMPPHAQRVASLQVTTTHPSNTAGHARRHARTSAPGSSLPGGPASGVKAATVEVDVTRATPDGRLQPLTCLSNVWYLVLALSHAQPGVRTHTAPRIVSEQCVRLAPEWHEASFICGCSREPRAGGSHSASCK